MSMCYLPIIFFNRKYITFVIYFSVHSLVFTFASNVLIECMVVIFVSHCFSTESVVVTFGSHCFQ